MTADLAGLISGGALASLGAGAYTLLRAWWEQRRAVRSEDRTDMGLVLAELRRDNERLRGERAAAVEECRRVEQRMAHLTAQSDELPIPMLLLTQGGEVAWLNRAACEGWLAPLNMEIGDVIGRRHGEVFAAPTSALLASAVDAARAAPSKIHLVPDRVDLSGVPGAWVLCVAADMRRSHVVGWLLLAFPG